MKNKRTKENKTKEVRAHKHNHCRGKDSDHNKEIPIQRETSSFNPLSTRVRDRSSLLGTELAKFSSLSLVCELLGFVDTLSSPFPTYYKLHGSVCTHACVLMCR